MKEADKNIILRELKSLKENSDLMIYAVLNDAEYPCKEDTEKIKSMENSVSIIKTKIQP